MKKAHKIILPISIVAIAGLVIFYFKAIRPPTTTQTTTSENGKGLNLNQATKEEKRQAEDNKKRLIDENDKLKNQQKPTPNNKTTIKPLVTRSEQEVDKIVIGGTIPSIFENGGVCVAQLERGSKIITRQVMAVAEGRSTFCPLMQIPISEFAEKGEWTLTITYSSGVYSGASDKVKIGIK